MKMQLAVLLTCFNRKATTLRCLEQLNKQNITASMDVFLCDDGSTDGTSDAIKKLFPQVYIIKGSGIGVCLPPGAKHVRQEITMLIYG